MYVPLEDLARFGCTIDDLAAPRASEPLRRVLALEAGRTAVLFEAGEPLVASTARLPPARRRGLPRRGRAALGAIAAARYEVLAGSPRPTRRYTAGVIVRVLLRAAGA